MSWTSSTGHFQSQEMEGAGQNPSLSARHPPLAQQQSERTRSGDSKANLEASAAKRGHPPPAPPGLPSHPSGRFRNSNCRARSKKVWGLGTFFFFFEGLAGVTPLRLLQCWIPAAGKRQECTCHLLQQRVLRWSCNVKLRPRSWGGGKEGEKEKKK